MGPTDKVLSRVRKLLALAESPNVHEAASAAARAQELISQHRLEAVLEAEDAAATQDAADPIGQETLETSKRLRRWKTVLAGGLARANGCIAFTRSAAQPAHSSSAAAPVWLSLRGGAALAFAGRLLPQG